MSPSSLDEHSSLILSISLSLFFSVPMSVLFQMLAFNVVYEKRDGDEEKKK
jgi:hypothetical protein